VICEPAATLVLLLLLLLPLPLLLLISSLQGAMSARMLFLVVGLLSLAAVQGAANAF
jgi:hypothetical protein